jgi:hypothetical protein
MAESYIDRVNQRMAEAKKASARAANLAAAIARPFDPDGDGYDEATGAQLAKRFPLTMPKPTDRPIGQKNVPERLNEGAFEAWVWHDDPKDPSKSDWFKHKPSSHEGMLLKGMGHKTIGHELDYAKSIGKQYVKGKDGRYYIQPIKK